MRGRYILGALTLLGFLFSCGGGGGGGNTGSQTTTITGKAIDDYLVGAEVCLDKNVNGKCDQGEPSTTTGQGGVFTLEVNPADKDKYPVVVEVGKDTPGNITGKPYKLVTPAGKYSVVSPLTSMVFSEMKRDPGISVEEAESRLKQRVGVNVSLFEDYISQNSQDYQKIAKVARVVAKLVADFVEQIEKTLGITVSDDKYDELLAVVYGIVADKLDEIKLGVEANMKEDDIVNNTNTTLDPDQIITSIETLTNLQGATEVADIWNFLTTTDLYSLTLSDGLRATQRIVKLFKYDTTNSSFQAYKAKLKNVSTSSDVAQNSYDTDKAFIGVYQDSNGNVFIKYDIYDWKAAKVVEIDLGGKTIDVCTLLSSDFTRSMAKKHTRDLCRNVTFQSGDKLYVTTMELVPIDMSDDNTVINALNNSISLGSYSGYDPNINVTSVEDIIRNSLFGSGCDSNNNTNNYFGLDSTYKLQYKPYNSYDLSRGDVVIACTGADVGDYRVVTDQNNTNIKYLIIDTIIGGAVQKVDTSNREAYFTLLTNRPYTQTTINMNASAMDRVLSVIKSKAKPLPDGAVYPNIGFDNFTTNNTFSNSTVRLTGWIKRTSVDDTCTASYSSQNKIFTLNSCGSSSNNLGDMDVVSFNYGYNTILIDPDSPWGFSVSYSLMYFDSDTLCLGAGPFNFVEDEFCITTASTPAANDISNLLQVGNKFAYYKFNGLWSLKYCLEVTGNSGVALQFTAYRYKTGNSISGTITINNGQALIYKTYDPDSQNQTGYLMDKVIKLDQTQGLIIGLDPDTKDRKVALMVRTNSCP